MSTSIDQLPVENAPEENAPADVSRVAQSITHVAPKDTRTIQPIEAVPNPPVVQERESGVMKWITLFTDALTGYEAWKLIAIIVSVFLFFSFNAVHGMMVFYAPMIWSRKDMIGKAGRTFVKAVIIVLVQAAISGFKK